MADDELADGEAIAVEAEGEALVVGVCLGSGIRNLDLSIRRVLLCFGRFVGVESCGAKAEGEAWEGSGWKAVGEALGME